MVAPTVRLPDGRHVRLGLIHPKARPQALRLESYLDRGRMLVNPPPDKVDYTHKAMKAISRMYLNDQYGCCVISGKAHQLGLWSGNDSDSAGLVEAMDQEILSQYQGICGPGDNGCIITDVLDVMKSRGIVAGGRPYRIDGYVSVDHTNALEVKVAQYLFGSLTLGINIPQSWVDSEDGGKWDLTNSRIVGGHDVCLTADTKIPLLDGSEHSIGDLAAGSAGEKFWVYSCDEAGNVVPGLAHSARKTGESRELVKVTLDNGEQIRCTPDHRFLLRDGTYQEAGNLQSGDSLMPLYRRLGTKQMKGYEQHYNPATKKWRFTHRSSSAYVHGGSYKGEVVHHKDFNKRNNAPENLEVMSWDDHSLLHNENTELLRQYAQSDEGRAKSREVIARLWADPVWRAKMVAQLGENGRTACNRKAAKGECGFQKWTPEDFKEGAKKSAKKLRGRKKPREVVERCVNTRRERLVNDSEMRARVVAAARSNLQVAVEKAKREGITERQREARRQNVKVALAARKVGANNHKVVSVEPAGREDVYDLTVDRHHNFALSAGAFVHNCSAGYDIEGVTICTWGGLRKITWAAFTSGRYLTELYAQLAPLWYGDDRMAPGGLSVEKLKDDLAKLSGGVIPDPGPVVPPTPGPTPGPTPPVPPVPPMPGPVSPSLFHLKFGKNIPKGTPISFRAPVMIPKGNYVVVPSAGEEKLPKAVAKESDK